MIFWDHKFKLDLSSLSTVLTDYFKLLFEMHIHCILHTMKVNSECKSWHLHVASVEPGCEYTPFSKIFGAAHAGV